MQRIMQGCNVVEQLWPGGVVHVPNMRQEVIEGRDVGAGGTGFVYGSDIGKKVVMYKPRMAGSLPAGSLMVVPESFAPGLRDTVTYLRRLELTAFRAESVVGVPCGPSSLLADAALTAVPDLMRDRRMRSHLFPFIHSPEMTKLARRLGLSVDGSGEAAALANHKGRAYEALKARGIRVPYGWWAHSPDEVREAFFGIRRRGAEVVYGKVARAASGMGVRALSSPEELEDFLRLEMVQIQLRDPMLGVRLDEGRRAAFLPNVMVYVGATPEHDRWVTASKQLLAKSRPTDVEPTVHVGNVGPLTPGEEALVREPTRRIVEWLREIGAFGLCGIDFLVEAETHDVYWLENNYRVNGNNPAAFMAMERGAKVWAMKNDAKVPQDTDLATYVARIRAAGLHYQPSKGTGIFVVNPVPAAFGIMQVGIMAESYSDAERLLLGASLLIT